MNLADTNKFLLIDASQLKDGKLPTPDQQFKERTKPIINTELQALDQTMLSVVNNNNLSNDEKVQAYNKALSQYQAMNHNKTNGVMQTNNLNNTRAINGYNPTHNISEKYKNKANQLWSTLSNNNALKLSNIGEIIVNDEKLIGTNITDLLNTAVNPLAKSDGITGWKTFQDLLLKNNIPKTLLHKNALTLKQSAIHSDTSKGTALTSESNTNKVELKLRANKRSGNIDKFDPLDRWSAYDSKENGKKSKRQKAQWK